MRYSPFNPKAPKTFGGWDLKARTFNGYCVEKIVDFIEWHEDTKSDEWIARKFWSVDCDPAYPSIAWVQISHMTEMDIKDIRKKWQANEI
ncbi:MAG: hypothetical protein CL524_08350 [Aequorivita sp.]|nr:hypothetical protein [Aequorivita sp.]